MKLTEVTEDLTRLDPDVLKKVNRTTKIIKSELKNAGKFNLLVKTISENKVEYILDFQHYVNELDLKAIDEDFKFAIEHSDKEGHIHKIEDGTSAVGYKFVDSILGGLRPGMTVKAEAFFPTLAYEVTWKMIMKKR